MALQKLLINFCWISVSKRIIRLLLIYLAMLDLLNPPEVLFISNLDHRNVLGLSVKIHAFIG